MSHSQASTSFSLSDLDPQPALVLSQSGLLLDRNTATDALCTNTGVPTITDLLPVNTPALIRSCLQQTRAIEAVESRVGERILLWTFIPDPGSRRVLVRGRDATDEIRLHDEAVQSNRLYRLITENTTDLISRHAPDGSFIDASPASWRLLGYWPEQLRGQPLGAFIRGDERLTEQLAEVRKRLRDEGYATTTLKIRHRDGRERWFEVASRAIRETYTGTVVEVVCVSRDITARVESEKNSRRLADELAHAARLATLGELASSIAHEMNQPLASIVNFASASQRYLKTAREQPEYLDRVDDGLQKVIYHANRASEVIKRLRAFLRKGQKRMAPVALNQVIATVARLCQWEADKSQIRIRELPCDSDPVITADPMLLEQVLINLVRNGIEAMATLPETSTGGRSREITLATGYNSDGEPVIEVTDQGPGLDDQGIRQMFQPFYTSKPHGLGLGLSMSRSIIEGFGGFLDARRAPGGGLTLTCRFTRNPARTKNDHSQGETHP